MADGINLLAIRPIIYSLALIGFYIWGLEGLVVALGISYCAAELICDIIEERKK